MASISEAGTQPTVSSPRKNPPKYCRQRDKNRGDRAYVRINDKTVGLGTFASTESRRRYAELIGKRLDSEPQRPTK